MWRLPLLAAAGVATVAALLAGLPAVLRVARRALAVGAVRVGSGGELLLGH